MANMICAQNGQPTLLTTLLSNTAMKLHIFTNNVTVSGTDTIGTYTEGTVWTGYSAATIAANSWTVNETGGQAVGTSADVTFTNGNTSGAVTLYGFFFTDSTNTYLLFTQNFASPVTLNPGDSEVISPVIDLSSAY